MNLSKLILIEKETMLDLNSIVAIEVQKEGEGKIVQFTTQNDQTFDADLEECYSFVELTHKIGSATCEKEDKAVLLLESIKLFLEAHLTTTPEERNLL